MYLKTKRTVIDENAKKYNEDDANYSITCKLKTAFRQSGKFFEDIDVVNIKGNQLDLCEGNIIFCHVDCLCLQGKKEDEARNILCYYMATHPALLSLNLIG